MKKIITLLALITTLFTFAQVPQGISYQAIALNSSGNPVVSSNVGIRLSVLDNSATGTVLYTETHTKTTNPQGLFNLVIGQGTPNTGTFSTINWGTNSKFLKVEIDAAGGTNYVLVGTTQLLSVPYALMAGGINGANANDSIEDNKYANFAFYSSLDGQTYAYNQLTGLWVGQTGGSSTIVSSNGNFAFYSSLNGNTYAFNKKTGTWIGQSGGSSTIVTSNGNFAFYSSLNGNTYAFNSETGTWIGQSGGGSNIATSNGNFAFYSSLNGSTYAFNKETNSWIGQTGGSSTIASSNGNFAFYSSLNGYTYVFNKSTNSWVGQAGGSSTIAISPSN